MVYRVNKGYDGNVFETELAINNYLAQHANAPVKTLRDILLSGKVELGPVTSIGWRGISFERVPFKKE